MWRFTLSKRALAVELMLLALTGQASAFQVVQGDAQQQEEAPADPPKPAQPNIPRPDAPRPNTPRPDAGAKAQVEAKAQADAKAKADAKAAADAKAKAEAKAKAQEDKKAEQDKANDDPKMKAESRGRGETRIEADRNRDRERNGDRNRDRDRDRNDRRDGDRARRDISREVRRIVRSATVNPPAPIIVVAQPVRTELIRVPVIEVVRHESQRSQFSTFAKAVAAAELEEVLRGPGPVTVFAPTDAAFAMLPEGELNSLLRDKERLRALLLNHVVEGEKLSTQVNADVAASSAGDLDIVMFTEGDRVRVNEAVVVVPDLVTSNGLLQGIDRVLSPAPGADPANPEGVKVNINTPRGQLNVEAKPIPDPPGPTYPDVK